MKMDQGQVCFISSIALKVSARLFVGARSFFFFLFYFITKRQDINQGQRCAQRTGMAEREQKQKKVPKNVLFIYNNNSSMELTECHKNTEVHI